MKDNPDANRYELSLDGEMVGRIEYEVGEGTLSFNHTYVDDAQSGKGLARTLVTEALLDARRRGLGVLPVCPYVRNLVAKDPEAWLDLVPADQRDRFDLPA